MEKKTEISLELNKYVLVGHPFSRENRTNNILLKCNPGVWSGFIVFDENGFSSLSLVSSREKLNWEEKRYVRKTYEFLVCQNECADKFKEDKDSFNAIISSSRVNRSNPEYKSFYEYTRDVLNDPLQDLDSLESLSPDLAKKYFKYINEYEATESSKETILIPYYYTFKGGISIVRDEQTTFEVKLGYNSQGILKGLAISIATDQEAVDKQYN